MADTLIEPIKIKVEDNKQENIYSPDAYILVKALKTIFKTCVLLSLLPALAFMANKGLNVALEEGLLPAVVLPYFKLTVTITTIMASVAVMAKALVNLIYLGRY